MSKKDNNKNISIQAEVFNDVLGLIDKLNEVIKGKEYRYVVKYNVHNQQFYIAKKKAETEIIYQLTYSKTIDDLIKHLTLMVCTLQDFTMPIATELEPTDDMDNYLDREELEEIE